MSLANGRHYLAIPGPSVVPDRVLQAMHRAAPNIYSGALPEMVKSLIPDLRTLAGTAHQAVIYIANGHGVWEAALANTVARGDNILVLATGEFGHGWASVARDLGAKVELIEFARTQAIDVERVIDRLAADKDRRIKAVLVTHVDTSTSVRNDIASLSRAVRASGHGALVMVDCIASLGCERFEMDAWDVDVAVSASQKGLMIPPGLGFVFFGPQAEAARARIETVPPYWDWQPRARPQAFHQYFGGTAPTHHLFGLREALDMILREEGLQAVWARHGVLARAIWAAFGCWSAKGSARLNIIDAGSRSHAVTAAWIGAPEGTALRDWLTEHLGVTLGIGLGMAPEGDPAWHGYFRIGHMGHVNAHMVLGTLGAIEAGMQHLGIAHGEGGLAAAARVCGGEKE